MEARGWLGIPYLVWGAVCLAVALVYAFVWPAAQAADATGIRLFLIRWGHTLAWALLAAMCFLKAPGSPATAGWANYVGMAALPVYLSFLAAAYVFQ